MLSLIAGLFILILATFVVLNLPVFGRLPHGKRLLKIRSSPQYRDGSFHNLSYTPVKPDGISYFTILKAVMKRNINSKPSFTLPSVKPDFSARAETRVIWFGHSSYFIQADGFNILVDPVFSKRTSPFSFLGSENYRGTSFMQAGDFPALDVLLITHDHYDHLDYQTILKLKGRCKLFVTSLGVGAHLERWGISPEQIKELSWYEEIRINSFIRFRALPARHFSGRKFKRNQSQWSSFILNTKDSCLYLGGDSGYDEHFKEIGQQYGPFDLAILECGQYNAFWPLIHMFPEQTVQAALDLRAKALLPVHWGKFTLALHDWDEPVRRVFEASKDQKFTLTTPIPGESVVIGKIYPQTAWWRN